MTANIEHRVKSLDAWRFVAVCLVFNGHLLVNSCFGTGIGYPFGPWVRRFADIGVDFFFFISGYVICTGLMLEHKHTRRISLMAFYVRRFFRIIPPLFLFLFACFVLARFELITISNPQLIHSALFLCNVSDCSWYAAHTWSLAYEEQFYLIFPLLFIGLLWALNSRALFLALLAGLILMSLLSKSIGWGFAGAYLNYMTFLLTGVVAALYKNEFFQRLHSTDGEAGNLIAWLICSVALIVILARLPLSWEKYATLLVYPPLIAYMVLATPVHVSYLQMFFENPLICYLGRISYSVYLWQQLATAKYEHLPLVWYPVMIIAVWVFAHYSFNWFETPLIHYGAGLSRRIKERGLMKSGFTRGV